MFERELEQEEKTLAAERGRSPSDAASVGGPAEPTAQAAAVDHPQVVSPAAEAGPSITAASGPEPSSSDCFDEAQELADDFLDEEPFPEEPFEERCAGRGWSATGKSKGRRLVKPEESAATGDDARAAAADPRHLAAERSAGRRLRHAGGRLQAHALRLEEEVRRAGPGRADGPAAGRPQGQPHAGADQADDPHAQAVESRVGLPADQRHAAARAGAAGLRGGRGAGAARGGLPDGRGDHAPASRQGRASSSGPRPISSGRRTCSPSC